MRRENGALFHSFRDLESQEELEAHLEQVYKMVLRMAATTFRRKSFSSEIKTNWGTPQLAQNKSKVRALQRRLKAPNGSIMARWVFSKELALYKKNILKTKREY